MNPPGISYFYVARDKVTAKKEVIDRDCDFVVSRFINSKDLRLIDFMELPDQISLFLPEQYTKHHEIKFLHLLKEDMIKPVVKDGREHIEYIPTQIISEYFRYRFVLDEGGGVDGFIYPGVKNRTGVNVVIFESSNEDLEKSLIS